MAKLTPKQERFVDEYLVDLNATQAAIRAGYSEKTAGSMAAKLVAKSCILDAIADAKDARAKHTEITAERVLNELAKIAFAECDVRDADKLKALELTGRHLGMFTDKVKQEVSGPDGGAIPAEVRLRIVRPEGRGE